MSPRETPMGGGWRIIARKELADHLRSVRFFLIVAILALAGLAAVHSSSDAIRKAASSAAGTPSIFLYLFTVAPDRVPAFHEFVGFLGPLLGIAFGFDAINSERAQRTLPRLVSQPVHRDDIVNGKFAAGLAAISLGVVSVVMMVSGYGVLRLGLVPTLDDGVRLAVFVVVLILYIALWLALAMLCSVVARRSATAALASLAAWLVFTFFFSMLAGIGADALHPAGTDATAQQLLANARTEQTFDRISPDRLYREATQVLLDPSLRSTSALVDPQQLDQAVPSHLALADSLSLAGWQLLVLIGLGAGLFVADYLVFIRQEVRA